MQNEAKILGKLPVHSSGQRGPGVAVLRVDGLVGRTLELTESDFDGLPQREVTADFTCEEGWTVPAVRWWGINLEFVLALAEIDPQAQWVQASAGEFTVPIPLQDARKALLATAWEMPLYPLNTVDQFAWWCRAATAGRASSGWIIWNCAASQGRIPGRASRWGGARLK